MLSEIINFIDVSKFTDAEQNDLAKLIYTHYQRIGHWIPYNVEKQLGKILSLEYLYEELVKYAEMLASDLLFCRVDFFIVDDHIYFNEFTFTPAKGTLIFDDDKADFIISEWFDISSAKKNKAA